ncbi:MAG: DMT family transporter [Lachnospiraceae bacterium]|nr:DMT family transporter [Lachnospiraceae bacterium]
MKNLKGTLILLLTALIWGTAFVAQTSASGSISAFTFNATRSLLASVFLFLFVLLRAKIAKEKKPLFTKQTLLAGVICGVPLFIATNLQQYGIELYPAGTAASGRAGFLTATYVIMIALYTLLKTRRFRPLILFATLLCMTGMYLLCLSGGFGGIYIGDVLILLCALAFAVYILLVDVYGTVESVKVSCIQFATAGILSFICMLLFESPTLGSLTAAWFPICYAGILSSGVAYTLQMVGQKYAEPVIATIVMSLEAVFAALSGWLILSEQLKGRDLLGCVLVFASVLLAQLPERDHS